MTARRGIIQPRKRFFVGCEGESEQSYVQLLQRHCDDHGWRIHLKAELLKEGDGLARLEAAQRNMGRFEVHGTFVAKFAFFDADQRRLSSERANQAEQLAQKLGIAVIWQEPCHEGLLVTHFEGARRQPQTAEQAMEYLQEFWPGYQKNMTAEKLASRIGASEILRVVDQVPGLADMLVRIKLIDKQGRYTNN